MSTTLLDDHLALSAEPINLEKPIYDERSMIIAGVLGSMLAVAYLMYVNRRRMGGGNPWRDVGFALGGLALIIGISAVLPEQTPSTLFIPVQIGVAIGAFRLAQHEDVEFQLSGGAPRASRWRAAAIALAFFIALMLLGLALFLLIDAGLADLADPNNPFPIEE